MNLQHGKTRRYTIFTLAALLVGTVATIATLGGLPNPASADGQNPITQNAAAPELAGTEWINTPNNAPIKLASRKGKVTILHFWTFGCINCKHNLPAYAKMQKQFADKDVTVIGVHTPETAGEAVTANVRRQVKELDITYPVLIDGKGGNWRRWEQQYWPTVYLIDKKGRIRYRWEGELEYGNQNGTKKITHLVEELLAEK